MTDTATATPAERVALYRSNHRVQLLTEEHPEFGRIYRCEVDGIRVHSTRNGLWRHDSSELVALLEATYGGPWGGPKVEPMCICFVPGGAGYCPIHQKVDPVKERAIERIIESIDAHQDDDDEFDRESQPEFNGSFR